MQRGIITSMITRIEGTLESLDGPSARITPPGGLSYEVLVSGYTAGRLGNQIGQTVVLETLHFIESQNQGAMLLPRLAGFLTGDDRKFFELFTTTKGIGMRKALRALTLSTDQIAGAIAERDVAVLQSLPEIGRRTAETIITTLKDKVDDFAATGSGGGEGQTVAAAGRGLPTVAREALEALVALGENRRQALQWVDQAMRDLDETPESVQDVIQRAYQIKSGG